MENYSDSVINAKVFASAFRELCCNFIKPLKSPDWRINVKTANCNKEVINFLTKIHESIWRGRCDEKIFMQQVFKISLTLAVPIEIWWYIMKCRLMTDENMFIMLNQSDNHVVAKHITRSLFQNIFLDERQNSEILNNMNYDFMKILLMQKSMCDPHESDCFVYSSFLQELSSHFMSNKKAFQSMDNDRFYDTLKTLSLDNLIIGSFICNFIEISLQGNELSLDEILHTSETFLKSEKLTCKKELKILNFIDLHELVELLKKIFISGLKPVNWDSLFFLLTCMINHFEHAYTEMKSLINYLLEEALTNLKKDLLLYVFILARHCSFPPGPNFPTYLQWFSSTFSSESSRPVNSKERSILFMDFLTEAAKYDASCYLKVHINRVPKLPIEYSSLVNDYVKLVKTILIDLNESTELGIFENISNKTSAEFDVETVLSIFSGTNEVPKCVLEATVFCKVYYENKFLVTLLSKFEGENSVRHKFILKLNELGKVPNAMFLKYKNFYE